MLTLSRECFYSPRSVLLSDLQSASRMVAAKFTQNRLEMVNIVQKSAFTLLICNAFPRIFNGTESAEAVRSYLPLC